MRILIAALALIATPALAFDFDQNGVPYRLIDPPAKWLETPPKGRETVTFMAASRLKVFCTSMTGKAEDMGCAVPINGPLGSSCQVAVSEVLEPDLRQAVLNHELAHCRGWGADHPTD
jgi:hypothetical protein